MLKRYCRSVGQEDSLPPCQRSDQHHSLMVYRALRDRGCTDTEMLSAALLHDSGKGSGRVPLWVRPAVVLTHAFLPGVLSWLARE